MTASAGINRRTGRPLTDFDHVRQSLGVIFTTPIGRRIMRRAFGSSVPALLGKPLTPPMLMRFYMGIVVAVARWEPRFAVKSLSYPGQTAADLGQGRLGVKIVGDYMPNALEGDFTVAAAMTVII